MTPFTMKNLILIAFMLTIGQFSKQSNGVHGMLVNREQLTSDVGKDLPMADLLNQEIGFPEPQKINALADEKFTSRRKSTPSYLVLYPGLRDLLLMPVDYEDIENEAPNGQNSLANLVNKELINLRFIERLQRLAENKGASDAADSDDYENAASFDKRENEPSMPQIVPTGIKSNNESGHFIGEPLDFDLNAFAFKHNGIKKNAQWPIENTFVRKAVRKQYMSPCHFKICNMGRKRHARY